LTLLTQVNRQKKFILSVRKKGIVILPKELREAVSLDEGSRVSVEVRDGGLLLKPLRPLVVRVEPGILEKVLSEEGQLEEEKLREILGALRA
jgi:AbrB family looped-hinge helix DNA binding protein